MANIARITQIVEREAQALGFDLVRVAWFGKTEVGDEDHTLQVMAERPETGQLLISDCAELSHRISDRIDALEEAGEVLIDVVYRLEVSSPGIDRPLTRLRDFTQWTEHEVKVTLVEPLEGNRKAFHGVLTGIAGEDITLDDRKAGPVTFAFSNIDSAKLVLTDRLIAATRPIDSTGAEEFGSDELLEDRAEKWEPVFGTSDPTKHDLEQEV